MKIKKISKTVFLLVAIFSCFYGFVKSEDLPKHFNGITLDTAQFLTADESELNREQKAYRKRIKEALVKLPAKTIVRVVFDANTEATDYKDALNYLRSLKMPDGTRKIFIMGELLDSDFLAQYRWDCKPSEGCTIGEQGKNFHDYKTRIDSYVKDLDEQVDIWEVGNEINGEWADEGCIKNSEDSCISDVSEEDVNGVKTKSTPLPKITAQKIAYAVNAVKNKPIAITFIDQPECTTWDDNTMSGWLKVSELKPLIDNKTIDYLLISYYEDNCADGETSKASDDDLKKALEKLTPKERKKLTNDDKEQIRREIYWNKTFNDFEHFFSNVRYIGFGEVGYSSELKTCLGSSNELSLCNKGNLTNYKKLDLLKRYYGMKVGNPKYIGGQFWWTAQEDITYKRFYKPLIKYFK